MYVLLQRSRLSNPSTYLIFDVDITTHVDEVLSNLQVILHHTMKYCMVKSSASLLQDK